MKWTGGSERPDWNLKTETEKLEVIKNSENKKVIRSKNIFSRSRKFNRSIKDKMRIFAKIRTKSET